MRRGARSCRHGTAGESTGSSCVSDIPRVQLLVRVDVLLRAEPYNLLGGFGGAFGDDIAADVTQKRSSGFSKERAAKASRNNGFKSSIDTPFGRSSQITFFGRRSHLRRVLVLTQRSLAALHLVRGHHSTAECSGLARQSTATSQGSGSDRRNHANSALANGPGSEVTSIPHRVYVAQRRHARRVHAGVLHRLQGAVTRIGERSVPRHFFTQRFGGELTGRQSSCTGAQPLRELTIRIGSVLVFLRQLTGRAQLVEECWRPTIGAQGRGRICHVSCSAGKTDEPSQSLGRVSPCPDRACRR